MGRYLKRYSSFVESISIDFNTQNLSDLLESLSIWEDSLLSSIKAEKQDIEEIFKYVRDSKSDIDKISNDAKFVESLSNIGLRKSNVQNTDDFETFLQKTIKFMSIFKVGDNDLMNPSYILIQSWNDSLNNWNDVRLYQVNDDIKKFYDLLSSKTIEIVDKSGESYIYVTSNSGNDWTLKNIENVDDEVFKKFLTYSDIKNISNINDVSINII